MTPKHLLTIIALFLALYGGLELGFRVGRTTEAANHALYVSRVTGTPLYQVLTGRKELP